MAPRLGASCPLGRSGGSPAAAVSLSVASTPSPSSVPRLQLSPKTFGVSIRTALPRTRRGSVSPPPHVPAPPGARAPPQPPPRADPAPQARGRRREPSRAGRGTSPNPAPPPLGPRRPLAGRWISAAPPPPAPERRAPARPPRAPTPARSAARPRRRLLAARPSLADPPPPAVSSRHGPGPGARRPPPAAPRAPGAQLILNWRGGGRLAGPGVPPRFPASGARGVPASLTRTTPCCPAKSMPR